jgi:hypothetical protein
LDSLNSSVQSDALFDSAWSSLAETDNESSDSGDAMESWLSSVVEEASGCEVNDRALAALIS